jgi:hypothetical protein
VWFGLDARAVLLMVGTQIDDDQLNTVSCGGGKPMLEAGKKKTLGQCRESRAHWRSADMRKSLASWLALIRGSNAMRNTE